GEAVGEDAGGRERDQRRDRRPPRHARPPELAKGDREREDQQRHRRLLEGALGEERGSEVGQGGERGGGNAADRRELRQRRQRRERGEDRDRDEQSVEGALEG